MTTPDPFATDAPGIDPDRRRADFVRATDLLGGQRATARLLGVSDRTVRNLTGPTSPLVATPLVVCDDSEGCAWVMLP